MPNRRLNHCCCFTVREGSLILGIVGIVGGLLAAIGGAILLLYTDGFCLYSLFLWYTVTRFFFWKCLKRPLNIPDIKPAGYKYDGLIGWCEHNLDIFFALVVAVGIVTIACNILLVIGVKRKDPCLIKPWIALCFAYISAMVLSVGKALFYRIVPASDLLCMHQF